MTPSLVSAEHAHGTLPVSKDGNLILVEDRAGMPFAFIAYVATSWTCNLLADQMQTSYPQNIYWCMTFEEWENYKERIK